MNKTCKKCKNSLDESAFNWDKNGVYCNGCWNFLPSCSGCNDPNSEGTHQCETKEHSDCIEAKDE